MSAPASKHFRTPLAKVRGRGSAKSGTEDFWLQRVTSVAGVPLTIMAIAIGIFLLGRNQAAAAQILGSPLVAITLIVFAIVAIYHMWIGLQEILTDYVHGEVMLLVLLMGNALFCLVLGFAACFAVLKLAFGM